MRHAGRACANLGRRAYSAATTAAAPPPPPAPRQRTALVQGSNRGLGLEFVRQLLLRPDTAAVVATCRSPGNAAALQALAAAQPAGRLSILQLDSTDERSIAAAAEQVAARQDHLDVLINASGILHDDGMSPETALARVTMDNLLKCFQVGRPAHQRWPATAAPACVSCQPCVSARPSHHFSAHMRRSMQQATSSFAPPLRRCWPPPSPRTAPQSELASAHTYCKMCSQHGRRRHATVA